MLLALLLLAGAQDAELRAIAEAVGRKDYATAEALSLARVERDPASALAWFYLGHARAAVERFAEAVDPLQKAVELGLTDPKVRFQLGHAAHRAGRHDVAVSALRAVTGRDEASYELGVSLFELKRYEEAVDVLGPLAAREGSWRSLARYHRGLALRALGREAEAVEDLRAVDDPRLRELPGAKAWGVEALAKAGYDSNVLLLPETSLARGSEEGAAFLQTFLTADWEGPVVVRGSVLDIRYDDLAEADIDAFLGEVAGRAALSSALAGRLSLHADAVRLGHDPLFRRGGAEAALEWAAAPALALETGLLWKAKDFRSSAFDDLDGSEAEAWARAAGEAWRAGYRLLRDDARENFLDVLTHRLEALVSLRPAADLELRFEGWLSAGAYGAPDPSTSRTRRDRRLGGRAEALWSAGGGLRLVAEAELERCDSSASDFDYTRAVGSLGALFAF
ncbi:MAG TPA: tetratricopeptide repeat protein [Planctomycetota bacterium]